MTSPAIGNASADALRSFIERIEHLTEEIKALNADKSDVFSQANGQGFDVKIMKALIAERAKDPHEIDEAATLLNLYRAALNGTIPATHVHVPEAAQ